MLMLALRLILKDKGGKQQFTICWFQPGDWDIFEKEGTSKDWGTSAYFGLVFEENSMQSLSAF